MKALLKKKRKRFKSQTSQSVSLSTNTAKESATLVRKAFFLTPSLSVNHAIRIAESVCLISFVLFVGKDIIWSLTGTEKKSFVH